MKTKDITPPSSSKDRIVNLTVPRSWQELTAKQLLYISYLITRNEFTAPQIHSMALVRFAGIRVLSRSSDKWLCIHNKSLFTISAEQVASSSKHMEWITSPMGEVTPLPMMADRTHVDIRLRREPLSQYMALENYYQAFIFTKDEEYLNRLCAVFYTNGYTFNDGFTVDNSKTFASLPFHVRYTTFLWYYHLKGILAKFFPHFFRREEYILEDEGSRAPNMRLVMNSMVRALTDGDVTKTDMIYATNTWTALAELDAKALEYKEYEKRMSNLKKHR
jgi:hypothetical protein